MLKYSGRRIIIMIPMMLAIILIIFGIMELTPGDPARLILGTNATQEAVDSLSKEMGFDRPFLVRYADYVYNAFQGDLGKSWRTGRPVFEEVLGRFPITVRLAAFSVVIALVIGLPLGILSAIRQYSVFDAAGTTMAMILASVPSFWLGMMAIILFSLRLGLLPSHGYETWIHYLMPAVTMACPVIAVLLRLTRTTMLETIRQDYIRTARAKGQRESVVIYDHALRNALLPVVTITGTEFAGLLGGVVTIETVFSINGVGLLILNAIQMKDVPVVTGCAIFLSFSVIILMLFVDIIYAFIDPRIKARYTSVSH